jgi:hypothetical protein
MESEEMTYALLLCGQYRNFHDRLPSLRQHILRDDRWHIYAYCQEEDSNDQERLEADLSEWGHSIICEPVSDFDEADYITENPIRDYYGEQTALQAHLKKLWGLKRVTEMLEDEGREHPLCVRARFDNEYLTPLEPLESFDPHCLYVPKHDNWDGYHDGFAVGGVLVMLAYGALFDTVSDNWQATGMIKAEKHVKWHLELLGIEVRRTSITSQRIRHGEVWGPCFHRDRGDILD